MTNYCTTTFHIIPIEMQKIKINSFILHKKINKNQSFFHKTHNVSYLMEPTLLINQIIVCFWGIKGKMKITKLTRTIVQDNNTSLCIMHKNYKNYNVINLTFNGMQLHDNVWPTHSRQPTTTNSLRRQQRGINEWRNISNANEGIHKHYVIVAWPLSAVSANGRRSNDEPLCRRWCSL